MHNEASLISFYPSPLAGIAEQMVMNISRLGKVCPPVGTVARVKQNNTGIMR